MNYIGCISIELTYQYHDTHFLCTMHVTIKYVKHCYSYKSAMQASINISRMINF